MIDIQAVFENVIRIEAPAWVDQADLDAPFIRLSGTTTLAQTTSFIAGLCDYNDLSPQSVDDAIRLLLSAEHLIMPGGLAVIADDQEPVYPSCCCGLESWREWFRAITTDNFSPWLGHDPAPWLEIKDGLVTVWADGGLSRAGSNEPPYCKLPVTEYERLLRRTERDLSDFLEVLKSWATSISPARANDFAAHIDRQFSLTGGGDDT